MTSADGKRLSDVFKTIGKPDITYVERNNGVLENKLESFISENGLICLLTGPSKTGKTTLYKEVLSRLDIVPIIVQCDASKSCDAIWRSALQAVDFSRIKEIKEKSVVKKQMEIEGAGELGWKWLSKISGRVKAAIGNEKNEEILREKILSEPGPDLLIPVLKSTNTLLIVEDFHYLKDEHKIELFQKWKMFIDNEVSVIVIETSHRAIEIAKSNKDLSGRIAQIDVGHWDHKDLQKICDQGFKYLSQNLPLNCKKFIAEESVGLPIIVQQVCLQVFTSREIKNVSESKRKKIHITIDELKRCMREVAQDRLSYYDKVYSVLVSGPREKSRKYKTYELILACFASSPIKFNLSFIELRDRILQLNIEDTQRPPAGSISSTLNALKGFQNKRKMEIPEWRPEEQILYILEPAFLFFVRWQKANNNDERQLDLFERLLLSTGFGKIELKFFDTKK